MNTHLQQSRLRKLWKDYGNILYCLPVILGIVIFTLIPMVYSLIYAFCDYNFYYADNQFANFGIQQFQRIFGTDFQKTMHSFYITFRYAIATIAISQLSFALLIAEEERVRPMEIMIGPVTIGGKKRITFFAPKAFIKAESAI